MKSVSFVSQDTMRAGSHPGGNHDCNVFLILEIALCNLSNLEPPLLALRELRVVAQVEEAISNVIRLFIVPLHCQGLSCSQSDSGSLRAISFAGHGGTVGHWLVLLVDGSSSQSISGLRLSQPPMAQNPRNQQGKSKHPGLDHLSNEQTDHGT